MNLLHLEYFCRLAETEHYTRTAEALFISQSNLSYAIATLESELGVELFAKKGRNVVLTPSGRVFYQYVHQALNLIRQGTDKIAPKEQVHPETIRIGCCRIWFLLSVMGELLRNSSHINISYTQAQDAQIIAGLLDRSLSLGLLSRPPADTAITCQPIRDLPFVLLVPRDHFLALRNSIDLREIKDFPVILRDRSSSLYEESRELFRKIGAVPNIVSEASSNEVMAHLTDQGVGLGICSDTLSLQSINVVRIPITYPRHHNVLYLSALSAAPLSDAEQHVYDYLTEHFSLQS